MKNESELTANLEELSIAGSFSPVMRGSREGFQVDTVATAEVKSSNGGQMTHGAGVFKIEEGGEQVLALGRGEEKGDGGRGKGPMEVGLGRKSSGEGIEHGSDGCCPEGDKRKISGEFSGKNLGPQPGLRMDLSTDLGRSFSMGNKGDGPELKVADGEEGDDVQNVQLVNGVRLIQINPYQVVPESFLRGPESSRSGAKRRCTVRTTPRKSTIGSLKFLEGSLVQGEQEQVDSVTREWRIQYSLEIPP